MTPEEVIEAIRLWASGRDDVDAVVLVGSWARGTARADSDMDVVIVCDDPSIYLADDSWASTFGVAVEASVEDWGAVQAKRVIYQNGLEVEFGFTTRAWAWTDPADPGTIQVARNGLLALVDKSGLLGALLGAISRE